MSDDADDATLRRLRRLRVLEPDRARAERVRARCHDMIARRQKRAEPTTGSDGFTAVVLQPALVGGLCISYLLAVVYDVIRLHAPH